VPKPRANSTQRNYERYKNRLTLAAEVVDNVLFMLAFLFGVSYSLVENLCARGVCIIDSYDAVAPALAQKALSLAQELLFVFELVVSRHLGFDFLKFFALALG
jgi:hypothetical protein